MGFFPSVGFFSQIQVFSKVEKGRKGIHHDDLMAIYERRKPESAVLDPDFRVKAAVFAPNLARVERFRRQTASSVRFGLRPRFASGF